MGAYRPLVKGFQRGGGVHKRPTSEKKVTLANGMSLARPILGATAAHRLIKGKDGALLYAVLGAASDMEGSGARLWDKIIGKLGEVATVPEVLKDRGTTVHGEKLDPLADMAYAAEMAIGIMAGKKTSKLARAAAAMSIYKGQAKARWYSETNARYGAVRKEHGLESEKLVIPVDIAGKEAMVEEMIGLGLAAATSRVENPIGRFALGAFALGHTAVSYRRSQIVNRHYAGQAAAMIGQVETGAISGQAGFAFEPMPKQPLFSLSRPGK